MFQPVCPYTATPLRFYIPNFYNALLTEPCHEVADIDVDCVVNCVADRQKKAAIIAATTDVIDDIAADALSLRNDSKAAINAAKLVCQKMIDYTNEQPDVDTQEDSLIFPVHKNQLLDNDAATLTTKEVSVQIVKNDVPITFESNLQTSFLEIVYIAIRSITPYFGLWYTHLYEQAKPHIMNKTDIHYPDKQFMQRVISAVQSITAHFIGAIDHSDFEMAVVCLAMFYIENHDKDVDDLSALDTFEGAIMNLSELLNLFETELQFYGADFMFGPSMTSHARFSANNKYDNRNDFEAHPVYYILKKHGIISDTKKSLVGHGMILRDDEEDTYAGFYDKTFSFSKNLFGDRGGIVLASDETKIRSTIDAIGYLLLLKRLMFNSNVYESMSARAFNIRDFVDNAARGADEADVTVDSKDENFIYLMFHYVLPMYRHRPKEMTVSKLFPGLILICALEDPDHRQHIRLTAHTVDNNLLALVRHSKRNVLDKNIIVYTHEAVKVSAEKGLGNRLRDQTVVRTIAGSSYGRKLNIYTRYDLIYFLCLGFIPRRHTI